MEQILSSSPGISPKMLEKFNVGTDDNSELTSQVGSRRYMSPEMKNNEKYNHKTDIWSAGIVFAELFENARYDIEEEVSKFRWKNTPLNIQNVINQYMLKPKYQERSSADELMTLFETLHIETESSSRFGTLKLRWWKN